MPRTAGPIPADQKKVIEAVLASTAVDGHLSIDIKDDDPIWLKARALLDSFAGVILTGPPGTGKSYYARQIGAKLVGGDAARVRFVQFHPSYQYEDFVQGFVPKEGGGYELRDKYLVEMARTADETGAVHVIVIDELNRGDSARIFGEALTYVEKSKRGLRFVLASGKAMSIPTPLLFVATMNPLDRGVDEVDAAFDRRFAKIAMEPDPQQLQAFLDGNRVVTNLRDRVLAFFRESLKAAERNPYARIGHAYFLNVRNEEDLRDLWEHQLRFVFEKAYRHSRPELEGAKRSWDRIFRQPGTAGDASGAAGDAATGPVGAGPADA